MDIESQFTQPNMGAKKEASVENQEIPIYFSVEDAIEMYKEKRNLMNELAKNIEDISENDDGVLRCHDITVKIHQICFAGVELDDLSQHIMHRVLARATIMIEMEDEDYVFVYDKMDERAEKYLKGACSVKGTAEEKLKMISQLEQFLLTEVKAIEATKIAN